MNEVLFRVGLGEAFPVLFAIVLEFYFCHVGFDLIIVDKEYVTWVVSIFTSIGSSSLSFKVL